MKCNTKLRTHAGFVVCRNDLETADEKKTGYCETCSLSRAATIREIAEALEPYADKIVHFRSGKTVKWSIEIRATGTTIGSALRALLKGG